MKEISINIDINSKRSNTDYSWQFGIGNDRAYQLLRKDVVEHVKLAHDELGFKYLRFHGILNDEMIVRQRLSDLPGFDKLPYSKDIYEESFRDIIKVYENVLSTGMKPFVEVSFMPTALCSTNIKGGTTGSNVAIPEDLTEWGEFIKRFITSLIKHFGKEEVESWYFEIWNEPDLGIFFGGSMDDYFRLFKTTSKAIKDIDENIKVGGPSTSGCKWIDEFISYCEKENISYDFVSTHHYPGDAFVGQVTDNLYNDLVRINKEDYENHVDLSTAMSHLFYHEEVYKNWEKGVLRKMDTALSEKVKKDIIISEFNSMAVFQAPVHDEKYSAAFLIKTIMDLNNELKGYMFWCLSDVFGELFRFGKPFIGAFGIVSNDGIKKPNFHAFKMLSMLYPKRLQTIKVDNNVEYSVFTDGINYQILIYAQDFDPSKDEEYLLTINFNKEIHTLSKYVIDDDNSNPKKEWIKMGRPDLLTKEEVEKIKEVSEMKEMLHPYVNSDKGAVIKIKIRTNDVVLLNIC